jgi:hypothetical protein
VRDGECVIGQNTNGRFETSFWCVTRSTGGISSQVFGRRRLGFSLASPVLENMDVALGFGVVEGLVAQEEHENFPAARRGGWSIGNRREGGQSGDMSITWKLDKISYDSNFCKKFIGMPSRGFIVSCEA